MVEQRLNNDVLYVVASYLDVESMLNLAKASRLLHRVILPAALRTDLEGNGRSIFSAIRNNDFMLMEKILRSPKFDINRAYQIEGKDTHILQYAVQHASVQMFKTLTNPNLYQAFLSHTENHPWTNEQGSHSNLLTEATRYGRSDLINFIVECLGVQSLLAGWPAYLEPQRFWDLNNTSLVAGLSGRKTAVDPDTIRLLSQYCDSETFVGVNGNPPFELKSRHPEAPYAISRSSRFLPRQWLSNSLHVALLQRQHPEARQYVRLETLEAWLQVGVDVNQQDGGLVDIEHANPLVSYFRRPLDFAAEGLDIEGMDFLISRWGAVGSILGIDNGSFTAPSRFTDVTTMSLLIGHRLWPHFEERGFSILLPDREINLPAGSTYEDMMLRVCQERASLIAAAPDLRSSVSAVEDKICSGINILLEKLGQDRLPLIEEESAGLPVEVFSFLHDEFLESPEIADLLVRCFGSYWIDQRDWNSRTPLLQLLSGIAPVYGNRFWGAGNDVAWHMRQTFHKPRLVRWLLENGADPNARDVEGVSPLRYALFRMDFEAVDLLLKYGADPTEVGDLINRLMICDVEEVLHNASGFMDSAFSDCFIGVRDGFQNRILEQVRRWDLHRTGVLGVKLETADGGTRYSITVPSTPMDSGLGLFLDTPIFLGSPIRRPLAHTSRLWEDESRRVVNCVQEEKWEAFAYRLNRLWYVLQCHCTYTPLPNRKRKFSVSNCFKDDNDRLSKRYRAM